MARRVNRSRRVSDRVEDWAAWVLLAGGMLLILLSGVIGVRVHDQLVEQGRREALDRTPGVAYNCACWEREWRAVEPVWTRGEGSRG